MKISGPKIPDLEIPSPEIPSPDHPITITSNPKHVRASTAGTPVADTRAALTLKEANYSAVQYIPRADANMALLKRSTHVTHCPYKGDANYFSITVGDKTIENAIWTYENPFAAVSQIAGHLAFYPDKVSIEELSE